MDNYDLNKVSENFDVNQIVEYLFSKFTRPQVFL